MVALLSYILGAEEPTISLDTNSLLIEYLICSTSSPSKAYFLRMLFKSSTVVSFLSSKLSIAKEPLGTGTLMAFEVNFPSKEGNALLTAAPAPVSVITSLKQQHDHGGIYCAYYLLDSGHLYKRVWSLSDLKLPQEYLP